MELKHFRFNYRKKVEDYSELIETVLETVGYSYPDDYVGYDKHYLAFNPLIKDVNNKSAMMFRKDGMLLMYNGAVEVLRDGKMKKDRSITPSEYCRMLGTFDKYIAFILKSNDVPVNVFDEYKKLIYKYITNDTKDIHKWTLNGLKEFRRFLFKYYILDKDVLANKQINIKTIKAHRFEAKREDSDSKIELLSATEEHKVKGQGYLRKRRLDLGRDDLYPITVSFKNGAFKAPAVCIEYPNGFKKIRMATENSKSFRYFCWTDHHKKPYNCMFEAKVDAVDKSLCYVVEGEFDSLSIAKHLDCDIYSLHNVNSLPNNLSQLKPYSKVVVEVDADKYLEVRSMIYDKIKEVYPDKVVTVGKKISTRQKEYDYNYLDQIGVLNKNMIINKKYEVVI